ncbi:MAG: FAD:protein FMN transferase [Deltaproteobacteria bacterium]|nr:FAD:protein FMN transferase [Deltaproteobacteria bacterium]
MALPPVLLLWCAAAADAGGGVPDAATSAPPPPASAVAPVAASSSRPPSSTAALPVPPPPPSVLRHSRQVGDLTLQALVMSTPEDADRARAAADEAFIEYARVLESFRAPDSGLEGMQRQAGARPTPLRPEVQEALLEAQRVCALTEGAFDPTAGAYDPLWPFDAPGFNQSPPAEELARRAPLVDCRQVVVDAPAATGLLGKPGMRLNLAEMPRGLALDRAMALMRQRGFGDAILFAGGDLVVSGHKAGRRWTVGVQDPRGPGHFAAVPVAGGAVFTVGDYEQGFTERGRRVHAVLDPRTGTPARGVRSVTVLAPTGMEAAALSRAVFVLGPDKGMKLVERLPQVDAVMVDERNRVLVSRGLEKVLKYRPPTDGP